MCHFSQRGQFYKKFILRYFWLNFFMCLLTKFINMSLANQSCMTNPFFFLKMNYSPYKVLKIYLFSYFRFFFFIQIGYVLQLGSADNIFRNLVADTWKNLIKNTFKWIFLVACIEKKRHISEQISSTTIWKLVKFGFSCRYSLCASMLKCSKNNMKNWLHNCVPKIAKITLGPF
jgi:hypothetical protein